MKKLISVCCIVCLVYGIVFSGACYAASLTDKEVIEAAKLLKALSIENENLKTQVKILQEGLDTSKKLVDEMNKQVMSMQVLTESRNQLSDNINQQLRLALLNMSEANDKLERRLQRQENKIDLWRNISGVAIIGLGVALGNR